MLSRGNSINRYQQWALAWLMNEERNVKLKDIIERDEAFLKHITFVVDRPLYEALYSKKAVSVNDPDAVVGQDIDYDDIRSIIQMLDSKTSTSLGDIMKDDEGWI